MHKTCVSTQMHKLHFDKNTGNDTGHTTYIY